MTELHRRFFVNIETDDDRVDPKAPRDIASDWIIEALESRPEVTQCRAIEPQHYAQGLVSALITRIQDEVFTQSHSEAHGKQLVIDKLTEIRNEIT